MTGIRPLMRAWIALIVLSLCSTVFARVALPWPAVTGAAILTLAWLKARIVLGRYMGLAAVPAWRRGFDICLGLACLLFLGLYLIPFMG